MNLDVLVNLTSCLYYVCHIVYNRRTVNDEFGTMSQGTVVTISRYSSRIFQEGLKGRKTPGWADCGSRIDSRRPNKKD
jgi:hypothetical protein